MNKFKHTTIKLSFLSVIISMAALLNTAPTAGATTQTAHNGQSVVDNRLILNPEIGIHITVDDVSKDYYVPMGTVSDALNYLNLTVLIMLAIRYTNLSHTKLLNRSRTNFLSDKPKCSKKANRAVQNTYIRINM
nr:hypothetical protein [Ruminococcus bromii]